MEQVQKYYEALHRIPEVAFQEKKTAAYLLQALTGMGYAPVQAGDTGLYADLCTDPSLPWLVLRADMDALPVTEETGVQYRSEHLGVMHACGHDAHMAMLLETARRLRGQKLPQNIRFLFQPAEEIISGAAEMIRFHAIPDRTVAVFGIHVWPAVPRGRMVVKTGALMASSTTIQIQCKGRGAHCGKRQEGADALMTVAQIATRFPEAEAVADGDGTVLFCGKMQSGTAHNVVAAEGLLKGTLRTFSEEKRQRVLHKLESIVHECSQANGTQAVLQVLTYNPPVHNPVDLTFRMQKLLKDGIADWEPALAAEDFACYQQCCPGALLWLGVGDTAPLHNGKFLVPEEVLPIGVEAWLQIADHKW